MAIARVAAQATGKQWQGSGTTTIAFPGNVTNANTILVGTNVYDDDGTQPAPVITKSAGTATIGAVVTDKDVDNAFDANSRMTIYRIPVTGTGSLTLQVDLGATHGAIYGGIVGINEYTGFHATPLDGTPVLNTGTGVTESTGAVAAHAGGLVFVVGGEASTGDFTYTLSDTLVFSDATGSTDFTGNVQDKLIAADSSPSITAGTGNSWAWAMIACAYLPAGGGGGGSTISFSVQPAPGAIGNLSTHLSRD